jgi:hypothetical protein
MYLYEFTYKQYEHSERKTVLICARHWEKALEEFKRFAKKEYS